MSFRVLLIILISFSLAPAFLVSASTTDGTIDSTYKYAWSSNGGWLNFGSESGDVHVTDSGLTGYIWSANYGWIKLNPSNGGVLNNREGDLSGSAWGENAGWLDFSEVAINSSGEFTGTITNSVLGTITFNCSNCGVKTDWRPASSRIAYSPPPSPGQGGGDGESQNITPAPAPLDPFAGLSVLINNGASSTNSAEVNIQISGGSSDTISTIDISNFENFQDFSNKTYQAEVPWVLTLGDGVKTIYVRLHNAQNQTSSVLTSNIELITRLPDIEVDGAIGSTRGGTGADYTVNQDVIVSGKTDPESTVIISFDDKYASVKSDEKGNYSADIGKIPEGTRTVELNVTNKHGNSRSVEINLVVKPPENNIQGTGSGPQPEEEKKSIFENIKEKVQNFFNLKPVEFASPTIIIPKKLPAVLTGKWTLFHIIPQNINK